MQVWEMVPFVADVALAFPFSATRTYSRLNTVYRQHRLADTEQPKP